MMNASSKWLGVMKSDVGWGGEKFGGLCPEATPKLTSLLLLACFQQWAETFLSETFLACTDIL